ncbi:MAG TPA: TolC family protein [Elusimicrobiales bacterium]|nr:TolC family protein [Elusimicrobiales bacterium]
MCPPGDVRLKLLCGLLLSGLLRAPGHCALNYTLNDCLRAAAANNTDLRALAVNRDSAKLAVNSALYDLFPQVGAELGYSDTSAHNYKSDADTGSQLYTGSLRVTQSLYSGGRNSAAYKLAKNSYRLADYSYKDKLAELAMTVKQYYFQTLQSAELVRTGREAVARKEHNHSLIRLLYQGGNEKNTNVDQAEYNVDKARLGLRQTEKSYDLSRLKLKQVLGLDSEEELELEPGDGIYGRDFPMTEDEAVKRALGDRVELRKSELNFDSNERERFAARAEFLPSVNLSAVYDRAGASFIPERNSFTTGIAVSLPLSGGFPLYTSLKRNKLERKSLELTRENLVRSISYQVRSAYITLELDKIKVELARKNLKIARDRSTLANLEYSQGSLSFIEFEDIENNLSGAESGLVEAVYALENAKAAFEYYIGVSPL